MSLPPVLPTAESVWKNPAVRFAIAALFFVLSMHVCGSAFGFRVGATGAPRFLVADDSMITLRVANNFAHHLGPYFNAGERTAANTSLFWPMLLSPAFRVYTDLARTVAILSVLSAACASLTLALVVLFAGNFRTALSSGITLLLLPGLSEYGASVWEHIPQMLLVTLAFQVFLGWVPRIHEAYRIEVCLMLLAFAFLLRPDTLPLAVAVVAGSLLYRLRWTALTTAASAVFALTVIGYLLLHHHLYDSFVPNTYYLKVRFGAASIRAGLTYVAVSVKQSVIPLFILALGFLSVCYRRRDFFQVKESIVVAALFLQTAYIVCVGGDVFLYGRFFFLVGPIATTLLWKKFWQGLPDGTSYEKRVLVSTLVITTTVSALCISLVQTSKGLNSLTTFQAGFSTPEVQPYANQVVLAEYLRSRVKPEDGQIGLFALGALSYYLPEYKVADFLGKADKMIAHEPVHWGPIGHNKWDFVHTLRDRNVSVIPFTMRGNQEARQAVAKHEDFSFADAFQLDPYLFAHYTYRSSEQLHTPGTEGLFIRNDLLSRFDVQDNLSTVH